VDKERDIGGIGVAIADESFAVARFENGCFKGPTRCGGITKLNGGEYLNANTTLLPSYSQKSGMSDVPPISEIGDIAIYCGNLVLSN
jgi:hypothetical protein